MDPDFYDDDHTEEFVDDFLAHFGVKGMKWGVRKSQDSSGSAGYSRKAPEKTKVRVNAMPGRKAKAAGGKGQPVSADARRVAIYKQKARKSTTDALSNKELKSLINRMQMEQQYSQLRPKKPHEVLLGTLFKNAKQSGEQTLKQATDNYARKAMAAAFANAAAKPAAGR